jgi:hypothetical protein
LPHRHARQNVVLQIGGGLGHAPRAARRADAAPFAAKGDERVARAAVAGQAQEPVGEYAAVEVGVELVFDELRQISAAAVYFGGEACPEPVEGVA